MSLSAIQNLDLVIGANYFDETTKITNRTLSFPGGVRTTASLSDRVLKTKAYAIFADATYHLTDKLAVGDTVRVKVMEIDKQGRVRLMLCLGEARDWLAELLAEADATTTEQEPYQGFSLDVGLDGFPEVLPESTGFDVDADDGGVGAKLDLARAYLEIDDKESARELLQEAAAQGSEHQRSEAEKLLRRLG